MKYSLPDLDYDYSALEPHYSARVLELTTTSTTPPTSRLNTTLESSTSPRKSDDFDAIIGLEKNLAFNLSGHVLHTLFWKNLSPERWRQARRASSPPRSTSTSARSTVPDAAHARRRSRCRVPAGARSSWEPLGERLFVAQIYDHQDNIGQSSGPLLVMDAWEHAYYLQYENKRPDYVEAIWNIVDWSDVATKFERARNSAM